MRLGRPSASGNDNEPSKDPSEDPRLERCSCVTATASVPLVRWLRARQEIQFFRALWRATPGYAFMWWALLVLRGLLPAALAVATGALIGAVQHDDSLALPLTFVGIVFVLFQVLTPLHLAVGANLGSCTGSYLNDRLMTATTSPPGVAHL